MVQYEGHRFSCFETTDLQSDHGHDAMKELQLRTPNLFQRVLGRSPRENASREVHNLVVRTPDLYSLTSRQVNEIAERQGVNLRSTYREQLGDTLVAAVTRFVDENGGTAPVDVDAAVHLASVLGLSREIGEEAVQSAGRALFRELVQKAVQSDEFLLSVDKSELETASDNLGLSEEDTQALYDEAATQCVQDMADAATTEGLYSPTTEAELHAEADRLGVGINFPPSIQAELKQMRLHWEIVEGEPPTIDPGIHLQKEEVCYAARDVTWFEYRTVTKRVRYGGPTATTKIVKGVYFRAGDIAVQRVSEDIVKKIDAGRLFLTNKRLLFMGGKKNTNIRLTAILDFTSYDNGIQVEKDTGKSPFLGFFDDVGLFAFYLNRALLDARA